MLHRDETKKQGGGSQEKKSLEKGLSRTAGKNAQLILRFNLPHKWHWTSLSQELYKTFFFYFTGKITRII